MAYDARVFRILVASPTDVEEERIIVAEVVQDWNYLNSEESGIILLPVRWETHSSPELGDRAQAVINRQLVDKCDMAVGVFWTRLGTPTSLAASGTVEEIERIGQAGKLVMLYFSRAKVDLESVDLDEYHKLKAFKATTFPRGLIESYNSPNDFREKLSRQLAMKVRDLRLHDSLAQKSHESSGLSSLALTFASGEPPNILPNPGSLEIERIICVNEEKIPDYRDRENETTDSGILAITQVPIFTANKDYYRESVQYFKDLRQCVPLRIAVRNSADLGVRDIYLDGVIVADGGKIRLLEDGPRRPSVFPISSVTFVSSRSVVLPTRDELSIAARADSWELRAEFPVIQAQRTILSPKPFFVGASGPAELSLKGTIYSSASVPFAIEASVAISVRERRLPYEEILAELGTVPG